MVSHRPSSRITAVLAEKGPEMAPEGGEGGGVSMRGCAVNRVVGMAGSERVGCAQGW